MVAWKTTTSRIWNGGPDAGYSTQRLYSGMMYLVVGFLVELGK